MAIQSTVKKATVSLAVSSTPVTYEIPLAVHNVSTSLFVSISSVSSLVGGIIRVEQKNPVTGTWMGVGQVAQMLVSGGGTPSGVNQNTASAALIAGSTVVNTSGITNITSTGDFLLTVPPNGTELRVYVASTSGTATATVVTSGIIDI